MFYDEKHFVIVCQRIFHIFNLTWIFFLNMSLLEFASLPPRSFSAAVVIYETILRRTETRARRTGNSKNNNKWKPFFGSEMRCVHCTRDTIFMYAAVCTERVRTIYTHFFPFFFLSPLYRIPVVIVRLSESIEGIARLMMSISRATGPAEVHTNRNGCSPGESRDTRTSGEKSDWE